MNVSNLGFLKLATLCYVLINLLPARCLAEETTLVVAINENLRNYFQLKNGSFPSYIKRLSKIMKQEGFALSIKFHPSKRVLKGIQSGEYAISPIWQRNKDREQLFLYSNRPFYVGKTHYFYHIDGEDPSKLIAEGRALTFVGMQGYNYANIKNFDHIKLIEVNHFSQVIQMLVSKRADFSQLERNTAEFILNNELPSDIRRQIRISPNPVFEKHYFIIFPRTALGERIKAIHDQAFSVTEGRGD